jgi:3-oxoacid CoA-transferase subunit A
MFYATGDRHAKFDDLKEFCRINNTTTKDILILLGDAGLNYYANYKDRDIKDFVAGLPITLFCIHGNHEQRANLIPSYTTMDWHGGKVYLEYDFPNILFAKDGEIYDFDGLKSLVIGGAYSVDKHYRIAMCLNWYKSEQPDARIKTAVEKQIEKQDYRVDLVLSHTCPKKFMPTELFMDGLDQSEIDHSTEEWLDTIEEKLDYKHWLFAHFHADKYTPHYSLLYQDIRPLNSFI